VINSVAGYPRDMRLVSVLVLIWLIVGAIAAGQRGYYSSDDTNCATLGTIAVTILAGPLNYVGVNPKVEDCELPQPSE
jgi:hypothetical protein